MRKLLKASVWKLQMTSNFCWVDFVMHSLMPGLFKHGHFDQDYDFQYFWPLRSKTFNSERSKFQFSLFLSSITCFFQFRYALASLLVHLQRGKAFVLLLWTTSLRPYFEKKKYDLAAFWLVYFLMLTISKHSVADHLPHWMTWYRSQVWLAKKWRWRKPFSRNGIHLGKN